MSLYDDWKTTEPDNEGPAPLCDCGAEMERYFSDIQRRWEYGCPRCMDEEEAQRQFEQGDEWEFVNAECRPDPNDGVLDCESCAIPHSFCRNEECGICAACPNARASEGR